MTIISTKTERETVIVWDADDETVVAWTADPKVARKWKQAGWPVKVYGRDKWGKAWSWEARGVPSDQVVFLRPARKKPVNSTLFPKTSGKPGEAQPQVFTAEVNI